MKAGLHSEVLPEQFGCHKRASGSGFDIAALFFKYAAQENLHLFADLNQMSVGVVKAYGALSPQFGVDLVEEAYAVPLEFGVDFVYVAGLET